MKNGVSLLIFSAFLVMAGCRANPVEAESPIEIASSPVAESSSTVVPVSPTQGGAAMTPAPSTPPDPVASQLADQARTDLAQTLGITTDQIAVASTQAVTWPDSSLGCPRPGMAYMQVLTPGYLILLEVNGKTYEYHANNKNYVFFCATPKPPVPGMPGDV